MFKNHNDDSEGAFGSDFDDQMVRKNFVSKVYGILSIQIAFTTAVIFGITFKEEVREWFYDRFWIGLIFGIAAMVIYLPLACCESVRKSYPCNFILLAFYTIFMAVFAGALSAMYEVQVVYLAFGTTALITLTMTAIAKFAPCDVTGCGFILCIAFAILAIISMVATIMSLFMNVALLHLIIACVAVLLLSFYLIFMTQLILGGRKGEIGPDEVILAVIILYTTIVEIFIYLLEIIQACFGE